MEKWALTLLSQIPDIKMTTEKCIARKDILDATCEICCDPGMFEEPHDHEPATDLYQCDVCNRTYHWRCLKQLQCYTEEQRHYIIEDGHWNCPACKGLSQQEKEDRARKSDQELVKVSKVWEPKEQMDT